MGHYVVEYTGTPCRRVYTGTPFSRYKSILGHPVVEKTGTPYGRVYTGTPYSRVYWDTVYLCISGKLYVLWHPVLLSSLYLYESWTLGILNTTDKAVIPERSNLTDSILRVTWNIEIQSLKYLEI